MRNTPEFPQVANWQPIINVRESFPSFTIEHIINYFIERKACDNKSNKEYNNLNSKAYGLFKHAHVQKIEVALDENSNMIHVECECLPEIKKNLKYKVCLSMSKYKGEEIVFASCDPCPAGKAPLASYKHVSALCYAFEEFIRSGNGYKDYETCNARPQSWNQPRKRKLESTSVYEIDFSKKVYMEKNQRNQESFMIPDYRHTENLKHQQQIKLCLITLIKFP